MSGFLYLRNSRAISLPPTEGPHPVGRMVLEWTDWPRQCAMTTLIWYPAADDATGEKAEYLPRKHPIPVGRYLDIQVNSIRHARPAEGRFPLLVLSPAMGRIPSDYTSIAEDLASFGYIVAGVTPTASARLDLNRREREQGLIERWVGDFRSTLDRLEQDPQFQARAQWNRIGVFGHSFGGAAAVHALEMEPRFRRGANLDGAPQGQPVASLDRPVLFILGAPLPPSEQALNDRILSEIEATCASARAGCRIENRPEAGHMNFSDAGILPSRFPIPRSHFDLTNIDGLAFLRTVTGSLRSFFDSM